MKKDLIVPERKFTKLSRLKVKYKQFFDRFDVKKAQFDKLPLTQKRVIEIANLCIENKNSHLYSRPGSAHTQIVLPEILITIVQENGYYEVDFVYLNQALPTTDKVIFDMSSIMHIFDKFDAEVKERMSAHTKQKEVIINNHLENLLKEIETFKD